MSSSPKWPDMYKVQANSSKMAALVRPIPAKLLLLCLQSYCCSAAASNAAVSVAVVVAAAVVAAVDAEDGGS